MILLRRIFFVLVLVVITFLIAAQIASSFFLKPILEREARRLFQVPISIDHAGANLFGASFWMKGVHVNNPKGFKAKHFLYARTISVNFNFLSLLTNQLEVDRILFKDPQFTFEINDQGELNVFHFAERVQTPFQKWVEKNPHFIRPIETYMIQKFSVRNGMVELVDAQAKQQIWALEAISFSLARLVYPPDPEEALPTAIYLSASIPGAQEGKILVLGRFNSFASKKSFDITGSGKELTFRSYNIFFPDFPLKFKEEATFQIKVKALCHENQVDLHHQVRIEKLKFETDQLIGKELPLVFGFPPDTLARFVNELGPPVPPFEFDFHVTGDLSDPAFNVFSSINQKMHEAISERLKTQLKSAEELKKKNTKLEAVPSNQDHS